MEARDCALPCGYYSQLCCAAGQICYTDINDQPQCGTTAAVITIVQVGTTLATSTILTTSVELATSTNVINVTSSFSTALTATVTAIATLPATAETESATPTPVSSKGLSSGAKAGIAVGVGVPVLALLGFFLFWFMRRRRRTEETRSNPAPGNPAAMQEHVWSPDDNARTREDILFEREPPQYDSHERGENAFQNIRPKVVRRGEPPVFEVQGS